MSNYGGGGLNAGGGQMGSGQHAGMGGRGNNYGGGGRGNTGGSSRGSSDASKSKTTVKQAVKKAAKKTTDTLGITKSDRSVHSYKDGGSRETISGKSYATAQLGMYSGLGKQKTAGTLSPSAGRVLSSYNKGRFGAAAADGLASLGGPLALMGAKVARQAYHNSQASTLGAADGIGLGGLGFNGLGLGSTVGSMVLGPAGGLIGGLLGGYLGNEANAQAHGLTSNSPNSIAGSSMLGSVTTANHPALNGNVGGNGGGNGGGNNPQPTAQLPKETAPASPFDWSQWSHLYTPETVRKALTANLPTSRNMAALPRSYYV